MSKIMQRRFIFLISQEFGNLFTTYRSGLHLAKDLHSRVLRARHPHFTELKSHRSCFSCFMRMPEKVLPYSHALCDICVKVFGNRSSSQRETYALSECILCGVECQKLAFRFVPPTASIRVLSVDGGGVRGIIPLMYLKHFDDALSPLNCPIRDHFDFVCGTSAGGLVVIRMFLLQWNTRESIKRFENVASQTFGRQKALLSRAIQLIIGYVEDRQYSLAAVQEAFKKTFDSSLQMFNPLQNDTKVAVTTTAVNDSHPWLFTNYNGGKRPLDIGYDVVRAEKAQNDITMSDAACCTSASPWFFKPQAVQSLGIFQDGGLQHNNPASIAQWEARFIWPNKVEPDFTLSLRTGTTSSKADLKMLAKSRFYIRLFKSFMRNLDGEDAWKRFVNSLPMEVRHRYHRLNVCFSGPEPSLDDALQIPQLKTLVSQRLQNDDSTITAVLDALLASLFYFELDELPRLEAKGLACSGFIFCRLDLCQKGLQYLYQQLIGTSSCFLVQDNSMSCVDYVPQGLPPFKRRVTFHMKTLREPISLCIRGITSTSKSLSGFPTNLENLIQKQRLYSPFGTIEHVVEEKPLPAVPRKRNALTQNRSNAKRVCVGQDG